MLLLLSISFILIGVFFGLIMGGHMGVDSCTKEIEENVAFKHMLEVIVATKNNKKFKENERKRMIYEQIDYLNKYLNDKE